MTQPSSAELTGQPLVITGSIATDHLMTFPGLFAEQLVADQLQHLSLSFLVQDLEIRRGGAGANIAFNLGWLGLRPALVGAVGQDFGDYGSWLVEHGVDIEDLHYSTTNYTARFLCTTDQAQSQIASFYPGAMSEAREISLKATVQRLGGQALVLIGPNDPAAMLAYTEECRANGYPFAADPSQQLTSLDGPDIEALLDGATYLFTNEYERGLLESKVSWDDATIAAKVGTWVTTLGEKGVIIRAQDGATVTVRPPTGLNIADPTGVGDAFRAGFLAAIGWGVSTERAAQLGCALASLVLEAVGPQEHADDLGRLLTRLSATYGADAAADVAGWLTG